MYKIANPLSFYGQSAKPWLAQLRVEAQPLACALACALVWSSLVPGTARAALGENESSIRSDSARLKASVRVTSGATYTTHELTLPTGTVVREFLGANGTVFAVTWHGPFKPDLATLLGSTFSGYTSAPRTAGSTRTRMAIDQSNLVVRASSHARSFRGLAYVPQLLPPGVKTEDLK